MSLKIIKINKYLQRSNFIGESILMTQFKNYYINITQKFDTRPMWHTVNMEFKMSIS